MARRVFVTFRAVIKFAIRKGWVRINPAQHISVRTAGARVAASGDAPTDRVDILPKAAIRALIAAAEARAGKDKGRALAMVHVLLFGGLRASEMRHFLCVAMAEATLRNSRNLPIQAYSSR